MIYLEEEEISIMAIDATFWVAVSFVIFFGVLVYLKIPQKVTEMLDKMISDIKNEIDESEKLRTEARTLLDNAQKKLRMILLPKMLHQLP
jgi:F-type H+-transporting ATPase subunit b